jgi:hypothetical protein
VAPAERSALRNGDHLHRGVDELGGACAPLPSRVYRLRGAGAAWDGACRAACPARPATAFCLAEELEACRADRVGVDQDACRKGQRRVAGRKDDFADHQGHRVRSDAENKDDLARLVPLVADASADLAALAGRDGDRWGDHRRATDHDCRLALGRDFQWAEDHDCQWAKGVAAECWGAEKRQPQGGHLLADLADPVVAGRAGRDAAKAKRPDYLVLLGVKAVRAELGTLASIRFALGLEMLPEQADAGPLVLRAVLPPGGRASAQKEQLVQKSLPVSAARRVPKLPVLQTFAAQELVGEQRLVRAVQQAWLPLAALQERPMVVRGPE